MQTEFFLSAYFSKKSATLHGKTIHQGFTEVAQTNSEPYPAEKPHPLITDNNVNMESTLKVATRPSQSRNVQTPSSPKPKKQPKMQTAKAESRNFPVGKSRNFNFCRNALGFYLRFR
ncbi:MAG: hypothetical protein ABSG33_07725 [Candidatus Bathyarchaeia archaeon]|jgi:hypothetical protein